MLNNLFPYIADLFFTHHFSPSALNLVQSARYSSPEILFIFLLLHFFLMETLFMYYKQDSIDKLNNAILILFCALIANVFLFFKGTKIMIYLFSFSFVLTKKILFQKIIILFFSIIVFLCFYNYIRKDKILKYEHFFLFNSSIFGCLLLLMSNHFFTTVLALEIISFSLYPLIIIKKNHYNSLRASILYFFTGILSTSLLLKGISLFSNIFIYLNFYRLECLSLLIEEVGYSYLYSSWYLLVFFVLSSFFFKIGAAPFHAWSIKVYDRAPLIITFFMMVVIKTAVFFSLVNIIYEPFIFVSFIVKPLVSLVSVLSMGVGSIGLYTQTKFKKFMAYSSITHVGFLLSIISLYEFETEIVFYEYFFIYLLSVCGIFLILLILYKQKNLAYNNFIYLSDFMYLRQNPFLFVIFIICFFSLAGLPPFSGFFTKMMIFFYLIKYNSFLLAFIFIIVSIISMYAYLRFISVICFIEPPFQINVNSNLFLKVSFMQIIVLLFISFILLFGFTFLLKMFTEINYEFILADLFQDYSYEMREIVHKKL